MQFSKRDDRFAEKLETITHRGIGNTRMKDFHDLYSLISLEGCLNGAYIDKVVVAVFNHRQTSLQLPLKFTTDSLNVLQPLWKSYQQDLSSSAMAIRVPERLQDVIVAINNWLMQNTQLCSNEGVLKNHVEAQI